MSTPLKVSAALINDKVQFSVTSDLRPDIPVPMDYEPPFGDGQGFLGLELLLMSFAGCVSTAIVGILRKIGKNGFGYEMKISGERRENPVSLEKINFEVAVKSSDINIETLENVVRRAETISPVWLAVKNNVAVEWRCIVAE